MSNQSASASNDPRVLLSTTQDLTQRVRLAQRGAWFPLLVFAAVTFGAIPFSRYGGHPTHCSSVQGGGSVCRIHSTLALWYWPIALVVAFVLISWFYLRRSEERGVGTRVQPFVAVGIVLTALSALWAFWAAAHPAFLVATLHVGPNEPSRFLYRIASPAGVIGLALLLLAWIERSRPLLIVTVVYLLVAVSTVGIDWFSHPTPWAFLPHLVIDGSVLLIGGIVLAATQGAEGPSPE
jgi:hypothetical protein